MLPIPVLAPTDAEAWDRQAEDAHIPTALLMESAGRAAAVVLAGRHPAALAEGVVVAAGPGNNGGDGWVLARALHRAGIPVWVAPLPGDGGEAARGAAERARREGVRELSPDGPWPRVGLAVDAILGTGARGAPRPPAAALLSRLHDLGVPVAALDGPSGVDLLTGAVHGQARADLSITFGGLRRGHLLARDEVGDLVVVDIGLPPPNPAWPTMVTDARAAQWLPRFRADVHKGDRGRVVVVGGDAGMSGAARLAGRAAFALGAGLVHVVAPADTVATLTAAEPDLQTLAHDFDRPPSAELLALVTRADALVVGPGLGRSPGRIALVIALLEAARSAVLDADGLIAFQGEVATLRRIAADRRLVLTPHPGEFRTLFPRHAGGLEVDPWLAATDAAAEAGCTVLLKGVPTVVAAPDRALLTVAAGNPGLATGGSGDLLAGFTGAALGQGVAGPEAAALAAQVLGRAADLAAARDTARALRPMDVVAVLPELWRAWAATAEVRPPILLDLPRPIAL